MFHRALWRAVFAVLAFCGLASRVLPAVAQDNNSLVIGTREPGAPVRRIELAPLNCVGSPALSRDGDWIAFDDYETGYYGETPDCWIVHKDGTGLRKLCKGGTPRWSPDGKQLLFMREREKDRPLGLGIYVINRDGTGERRVAEGRWPDWSPDGKKIAYSVGVAARQGGARPLTRICIANLDGTDVQEIAFGDCPSWSPDGEKIACCFVDPAIQAPLLRVIDVDSGTQQFAGYGWFRPNWAVDGKHLYASGLVNANTPGIFRIPLKTGKPPEQLFADVAGGNAPVESADGKHIVFVAPAAKP